MAEVKETSTKQAANEPAFTKEQILGSKKYTGNRDLQVGNNRAPPKAGSR